MDEIIIYYELVKILKFCLFFFYSFLISGCFPYIKYHCTQRRKTNDLLYENRLYNFFKILNLGIPTLMYGLVAIFLIRHYEIVNVNSYDSVKIYFLIKENYGALF